jgi:hypothetical protein
LIEETKQVSLDLFVCWVRLTAPVLDDIFGSYILDSRPSSEFQYENAKNKLVNLELSADEVPNIIFTTPGDELTGKAADGQVKLAGLGRQGRLMRLAAWIDLDSRLTVQLLYCLEIFYNH